MSDMMKCEFLTKPKQQQKAKRESLKFHPIKTSPLLQHKNLHKKTKTVTKVESDCQTVHVHCYACVHVCTMYIHVHIHVLV